jgi:hypothetical protein
VLAPVRPMTRAALGTMMSRYDRGSSEKGATMAGRTLRGARHRAAQLFAISVPVALLLGLLVVGGSAGAAAPVPPAHAASAGPIYFVKNIAFQGGLRIKPQQIGFAADGNDTVTGLRWRTWGSSVTRAFGTNHVDNCIPDCATGHISLVRVQVSLSSPGIYLDHRAYLCYRVKPANAYLEQRHCLR